MDVGAGRELTQMTSSCQRHGDDAVNVWCPDRSHQIGVGQSGRVGKRCGGACSANLVEDAPTDCLAHHGQCCLCERVGVDVVEVGEEFDQRTEWHLASATRQQCP